MKKTREDAHELVTLCSLRTASSDTLRLDTTHEPMKNDLFPRSRDECRALSPRQRQQLIQSRVSDSELDRAFGGPGEEVLLELSRTAVYGPVIHRLAMRFVLRNLEKGQVTGLARALVALSAEEIHSFLSDMSCDERKQWDTLSQITIRSASMPGIQTRFWCALVTAMAEAHSTLDRERALTLLAMYDLSPQRQCPAPTIAPLAHLFPPKTCSRTPAEFVLEYVCASYDDRLPQARDGDAHPPASELALEVFAAYFTALPAPRALDDLLDRLVAGLGPRASTFACSAPGSSPHTPIHSALPGIGLSQHPASPYLLFALRLATWSAAARAGLVARGVAAAVEALYDADDAVVSTAHGARAVSTISQHIMLQLCFRLLGALGDCYDADRSTLMEELREEIVSYSRSMSRRFFAPEVWEIRDD